MAINTQGLAYKTRQELLDMLVENATEAEQTFYDEQYQALENCEQIIYALRNYELED